MGKTPILSIVIANYNYGRFLSDALDSIFRQCGGPFKSEDGRNLLPICGVEGKYVEVIICDGGSSDDSVNIIKGHSDSIAWWCSERDGGQSDAFNKGFAHAIGEFITWLNADEIYTKGTLVAFCKHLEKHPSANWVTSNDYAFKDTDFSIGYICWGPHFQFGMLSAEHTPSVAFGPSSFMRRSMYEQVGSFDIDIHYGMDTTYWHRLIRAGFRQSRLNRFSWGFRVHAESKTSGTQTAKVSARRHWEEGVAETRYGPSFQYSWWNPWYMLWMLCRLCDGSLLVNLFLRFYLRGKDARTIWKDSLWK